jgi:hypothetical protein
MDYDEPMFDKYGDMITSLKYKLRISLQKTNQKSEEEYDTKDLLEKIDGLLKRVTRKRIVKP